MNSHSVNVQAGFQTMARVQARSIYGPRGVPGREKCMHMSKHPCEKMLRIITTHPCGRTTTFLLALLVTILALSAADPVSGQALQDSNHLVNPFVGADGGGNTVPGAGVPFGFVSLSPDTTNANSSGYDSKGLIIGFSHTHVSGTGGGSKYGNFRVTPTVGAVSVNNLAFQRFKETASPGLYQVQIGKAESSSIQVSLTASRLVGFDRFTYPKGTTGNIVIDVTSCIPLGGEPMAQHPVRAEVTILDEHHVSGSASFKGGWNPAPYTIYFFASFEQPMRESGTWSATLSGSALQTRGRHLEEEELETNRQNRMGMFATFDTAEAQTVQMKLAVSMVSVAQAKQNLDREMPGWNFGETSNEAAAKWRSVLDLIRVEGGDDEQRRIFYSALFRSHQMPHDLSGENAWWQSSEPHYEDFYTIWDTFRTLHPLFTLLEPDRESDMVRSLLDTYRHTGWLPDGRVAGANGLVQGGSNADVVIADAIVKGLTGIDVDLAYDALLKDAELQSPDPLMSGRELTDYRSLGYMSLSQTRSASRTLEYSYDDFAISEVAARLGHPTEAQKYLTRSRNWQNLWNDEEKCIVPRYADGRWLENFDCNRDYPDQTTAWWDAPFYEGRPRQYSTFVPHDVPGLIKRLGGNGKFTEWLDVLFDQGFYTQGNEQDLLAPYLYIHAGHQERVCERVRAILAKEYKNDRAGLPGNDDAGTMSSWYVWSAIGIYPNAGQTYYYIGSPLFAKSTIQVGQGKQFQINAIGVSATNIYVQSAELNGKRLDRAWLLHEEIAAGGSLTLHMGPSPSSWERNGEAPPYAERGRAEARTASGF